MDKAEATVAFIPYRDANEILSDQTQRAHYDRIYDLKFYGGDRQGANAAFESMVIDRSIHKNKKQKKKRDLKARAKTRLGGGFWGGKDTWEDCGSIGDWNYQQEDSSNADDQDIPSLGPQNLSKPLPRSDNEAEEGKPTRPSRASENARDKKRRAYLAPYIEE
jgi:curved DNA-binding protein CbpA